MEGFRVVIQKSAGEFIVFPDWNAYGDACFKVSFEDQTCQAYLSQVRSQPVLRFDFLQVNGRRAVGLSLTNEQKQALCEMLDSFKQDYWERFKRGDFNVTLKWEQEVSNYDYPTLALNRWNLSWRSKVQLKKLGEENFPNVNKIKLYAQEKELLRKEKRIFRGWSEVELTDYILELSYPMLEQIKKYVTPNEKKSLEKEKAEIIELLKDDRKISEKLFTSMVHVDEEGYFSNCPWFCDDCSWFRHVKKEYIDVAKAVAKRFYVSSRKGKTYTYYSADESVLDYLIKKLPNMINKEKQRLSKRLSEIDSILTNQSDISSLTP